MFSSCMDGVRVTFPSRLLGYSTGFRRWNARAEGHHSVGQPLNPFPQHTKEALFVQWDRVEPTQPLAFLLVGAPLLFGLLRRLPLHLQLGLGLGLGLGLAQPSPTAPPW